MKLNITQKLVAGFLVVLFLVIVTGAIFYENLEQIELHLQSIYAAAGELHGEGVMSVTKHLKCGKIMIFGFVMLDFLVTVVVVLFLSNKFTDPIISLSAMAREISKGNWGNQIDIDSQDEIGELAGIFNHMSKSILDYRNQIERAHVELKKRDDILVKANKELKEANSRLQVADQKKKEILVTVAHDIRGPLSSIKGCVSVVLGGYIRNDREKQDEMLKRADQRIEELLRFTNDMLDLSLMEESQYDQEEVDCASMIDSLLPELRQQAIKRGITLVCETPIGPLMITGARKLLLKGFLYIIENAIKYSHPNGRVSIIYAHNNGHIELSVIDEGIGIPEEDIHSIFEPNFRGQMARRHDQSGTGVSMALVEKIVTVHRGKIAVRSEVGHGTEVIVSLPSRIPDPDQEVLVNKNREMVPV